MESHYRNYKQARCQPGAPIHGQASLSDGASSFSPITYVVTGQVLQCGPVAPLSRKRATEAEHDHHNLEFRLREIWGESRSPLVRSFTGNQEEPARPATADD